MSNEWKDKIRGYAERMSKTEEEAMKEFKDWVQAEFSTSIDGEDEYFVNEWAEMFVIETRNLGRSGGGRDTVTFMGHITGLNDSIRDQRQAQREKAVQMFRQDRDRAINQGLIGVVKIKDGVWHVNGEPTNEKVGEGLPWFAFKCDDTVVTLLNTNRESPSFGKPIAHESKVRYLQFLGNTANEFVNNPQMWRVALGGEDMTASYKLGQLCEIQVVPSSNQESDILYTNRAFVNTVKYAETADLPADFTDAARFWVSSKHDSYVNLANLLEEYDDRKVAYNDGYIPPVVITKGYISRMSTEPSNNEYDDTGRNFRISITSLDLQSTYGRESSLSEVTVWIPGRTFDDTNPFEFFNGEEWVPYAERTQVLICGKLKTRKFRDDMVPSLTALGIYVPPRTARPGARGGNTDTSQFEE